MFNSILVVCIGNICRSPTGERLLKHYLPAKYISSAGLSALVGQPADNMAEQVAKEHHLSLENHIARQLTADLCRENDLILVMEKKHVDTICHINPSVRGKTMLFGHWINDQEIFDPYRKGKESFEITFNLLDSAAKKWQNVLSN